MKPSRDEFETMVGESRERLRAMDNVDISMGNATPQSSPIDVHMDAVCEAMEAAVRAGDWGVACDAMLMGQDVLRRMRSGARSGRPRSRNPRARRRAKI